eukprot:TRINITY_DN1425_c0_g1_i7.p1 TRINITY_DN1425_c0_g1~~TRINITY_DN1425_c0_g1_i7.p1  ORF type:complete len:123 (-),score=33.55 TRINITY_DN1425_c0_g1_i7:75-443(-)
MMVMGDVCAWVSGLLYFFGRIPQVWHNYKRKSVAGLSLGMFVCASLGNLCYGTSIVISGANWGSAIFWENVFPYILGSYGVLIWSAMVFAQFIYYGWLTKPAKDTSKEPLLADKQPDKQAIN